MQPWMPRALSLIGRPASASAQEIEQEAYMAYAAGCVMPRAA